MISAAAYDNCDLKCWCTFGRSSLDRAFLLDYLLSPFSHIVAFCINYAFQGLWGSAYGYAGPTILFFQENAGSILIVIVVTNIIWKNFCYIA